MTSRPSGLPLFLELYTSLKSSHEAPPVAPNQFEPPFRKAEPSLGLTFDFRRSPSEGHTPEVRRDTFPVTLSATNCWCDTKSQITVYPSAIARLLLSDIRSMPVGIRMIPLVKLNKCVTVTKMRNQA